MVYSIYSNNAYLRNSQLNIGMHSICTVLYVMDFARFVETSLGAACPALG